MSQIHATETSTKTKVSDVIAQITLVEGSLIIAAISVAGYLVAYLDRLGQAVAYRIPHEYIFISFNDIFLSVGLVFVAAIIAYGISVVNEKVDRFFPLWLRRPLESFFRWITFGVLGFIILWDVYAGLFALLLSIVIFAVEAAVAFLLKRKRAKAVRNVTEEQYGKCKNKACSKPPIVFIATLIIVALSVMAFIGGNARATSQENHLVSVENERVVLLTIYSNGTAVLGELTCEGDLSDVRHFVPADKFEGDFIWKSTGRILENESGLALSMPSLWGR